MGVHRVLVVKFIISQIICKASEMDSCCSVKVITNTNIL